MKVVNTVVDFIQPHLAVCMQMRQSVTFNSGCEFDKGVLQIKRGKKIENVW